MVAFLACMEVIGSGYQVSHCKYFILLLLVKKKDFICCIFILITFYKLYDFQLFYICSNL